MKKLILFVAFAFALGFAQAQSPVNHPQEKAKKATVVKRTAHAKSTAQKTATTLPMHKKSIRKQAVKKSTHHYAKKETVHKVPMHKPVAKTHWKKSTQKKATK
ncbi:MAG: hypothetical protein JXR71_02975 [Bacteroidales bacterium]|nr:hypothetical protein [Bacteroidales bacterium]